MCILISYDLNSIFTRQTSEKVAYKPGLENLLECFLPSTFARKISKRFETGRVAALSPPSPPFLVRLWRYMTLIYTFHCPLMVFLVHTFCLGLWKQQTRSLNFFSLSLRIKVKNLRTCLKVSPRDFWVHSKQV